MLQSNVLKVEIVVSLDMQHVTSHHGVVEHVGISRLKLQTYRLPV